MFHERKSLVAALILPLALVACNGSNDTPNSGGGGATAPRSLLELLAARGLTTLADAVHAAGLDAALDAAGSLTLFAPTNDAFAALPAGELQRLLEPANVNELRALLFYHLVDGRYPAATLEGLSSLMSLQGADLTLDSPGGVLFVNDARIVAKDVSATNGLLHEVNSVLTPPASLLATLDTRGFTILLDLIDRAGLTGALTGGNLTLIAPTDAAFNALPAGRLDALRDPMNQAELIDLLSFHILPGRVTALELLLEGDLPNLLGDLLFGCVHGNQFRVNGTACPRFNLPATDGFLHVSSAVLDRTAPLRQVLADLGLTTLAGLVDLAGLDVPLSAQGTYTLFAPSEAAFAALDPLLLAALQDPVNQAQRLDFLQRHLIGDALQEVEIARRDDLLMANGQTFLVDISNGLSVGGVPVTNGDRFATNGLAHVIDAALPQP
ncbi:MAG: fasciclin domain-containing protein [Planctomycetota bacterium]